MKTYPIVGVSYRPPSQTILEHLALNTPLVMRREPDNRFDPNAIAIWIETSNIPPNDLDLNSALSRRGFSIWELKANDEFQLGYIPATIAAVIAGDFPLSDTPARFAISGTGKPIVVRDEVRDEV